MAAKPDLEALSQRHVEQRNHLFELMNVRSRCKLMPPPKHQEWLRFAEANRDRFSSSFLEFLQLHNGWTNFLAAYTFIGVAGSTAERIQSKISRLIKAYRTTWTRSGRSLDEDFIARWEEAGPKSGKTIEEAHLFLPNLGIFAITPFGNILAFAPKTRTARGEMQVFAIAAGGAIANKFSGFVTMLEYYNQVQQELLETRLRDRAAIEAASRREK